MNRELASIVFTVYNQERYVRESLMSALSQTYEPLEVVVSDDGSTDGTRTIIDAVIDELGFVRVPCGDESPCIRKFCKGEKMVLVNFNAKNRGICENFEYAFGLTHGELVFTFGGDDVSMPDRVAAMMAAWIAEGKKVHVLASGGWLMDVEGTCYREYRREVLDGAPVGAFNAYARNVYDDFKRIRPELAALTYEDSVYGLRAQFFAPPQYVDQLLVRYRFGSGVSTGGGFRKKMIRGARAVKASCEQLTLDLDAVKGIMPEDAISKKRFEFERRVQHESHWLSLLEGKTFPARFRGFRATSSHTLPIKLKLLRMILLFPSALGNAILRLVIR